MPKIYSEGEMMDVIGGKFHEPIFRLAAAAVRSFRFLCIVAERQYDRNKFLYSGALEKEAHHADRFLDGVMMQNPTTSIKVNQCGVRVRVVYIGITHDSLPVYTLIELRA